jgi:hypothetical protein
VAGIARERRLDRAQIEQSADLCLLTVRARLDSLSVAATSRSVRATVVTGMPR